MFSRALCIHVRNGTEGFDEVGLGVMGAGGGCCGPGGRDFPNSDASILRFQLVCQPPLQSLRRGATNFRMLMLFFRCPWGFQVLSCELLN